MSRALATALVAALALAGCGGEEHPDAVFATCLEDAGGTRVSTPAELQGMRPTSVGSAFSSPDLSYASVVAERERDGAARALVIVGNPEMDDARLLELVRSDVGAFDTAILMPWAQAASHDIEDCSAEAGADIVVVP